MRVLITSQLGWRRRSSQRGPMAARFNYQVTDDRGGKATTHFGGGGGDHEWRGRLTASQPLAMDTAWIELDGARIELVDSTSLGTVTIETVPAGDPAHRYLWHWLASLDRHRQRTSLEPILQALIAAGYLDVEDPTLELMREAQELMPRGAGPSRGGAAAAPVDGVPAEWQSLLRPKPNRRPANGSIAVAAVTPPFDGIAVTVDEFTADANGWHAEVDVTPGISAGPFAGSLDGLRIAWWAADDRGQYYLGQLGQWSGGSDGLTGTLEFGPAIDRAAKAITLLPTGPTERARIEFPLDWSAG